MPDTKDTKHHVTPGAGNTTSGRNFTLDRFEQEVADEISFGRRTKTTTPTTTGQTTTTRGTRKTTEETESERP